MLREAYEEAHDDGHGEADDEEAYAEEDTDARRATRAWPRK